MFLESEFGYCCKTPASFTRIRVKWTRTLYLIRKYPVSFVFTPSGKRFEKDGVLATGFTVFMQLGGGFVKKNEFSKIFGRVWTGPRFFYNPFTFVHECNVGNGADSNELRRVSQENVAQKCRLHIARLCLHYPDSFYPFTLRQRVVKKPA